jgi:hypothetical protein
MIWAVIFTGIIGLTILGLILYFSVSKKMYKKVDCDKTYCKRYDDGHNYNCMIGISPVNCAGAESFDSEPSFRHGQRRRKAAN